MSFLYEGDELDNKIAAEDVFPYFDQYVEMYGFGGNDELVGAFLHPNIIYGGSGNDILKGGADSNYIYGEAGNDNLNSWQSTEYSWLYGGDGSDYLNGGIGGNYLDGGNGDDFLVGGDGADIYIVDSLNDQVSESYVPYFDNDPNPEDVVHSSVDWALGVNIESLILLDGAWSGIGNVLKNTLIGNNADNVLMGVDGNDVITGRGGSDKLYGGLGHDRMVGNSGNDLLYGGSGNDRSLGGTGVDQLKGQAGDDALFGQADNDRLDGGVGNDRLVGGLGADKLLGGSGADILIGNVGRDVINAGDDTDRDIFKYNQISDSKVGAADRLVNFDSGEDVIDLRAIDANVLQSGDQAFQYNGFEAAVNSVWLQSLGADLILLGDIDGDMIADFEIVIVGQSGLESSDILF